jgi:CheY-like chemotaxis protein
VIACDGAQAVDLVRERSFDLILMDIRMPVMDGLVATEKIRQFELESAATSNVPVVAYSSEDIPPEMLRQVGLSAALRKPSDAMTMGECLRRWCGERLMANRPRSV